MKNKILTLHLKKEYWLEILSRWKEFVKTAFIGMSIRVSTA
jgi:hypothetical protein